MNFGSDSKSAAAATPRRLNLVPLKFQVFKLPKWPTLANINNVEVLLGYMLVQAVGGAYGGIVLQSLTLILGTFLALTRFKSLSSKTTISAAINRDR